MMEKYGWICPKCERVYSGMKFECSRCNLEIERKDMAKDVIQEPGEDDKTLLNQANGNCKLGEVHEFKVPIMELNAFRCKSFGWSTSSLGPHLCSAVAWEYN